MAEINEVLSIGDYYVHLYKMVYASQGIKGIEEGESLDLEELPKENHTAYQTGNEGLNQVIEEQHNFLRQRIQKKDNNIKDQQEDLDHLTALAENLLNAKEGQGKIGELDFNKINNMIIKQIAQTMSTLKGKNISFDKNLKMSFSDTSNYDRIFEQIKAEAVTKGKENDYQEFINVFSSFSGGGKYFRRETWKKILSTIPSLKMAVQAFLSNKEKTLENITKEEEKMIECLKIIFDNKNVSRDKIKNYLKADSEKNILWNNLPLEGSKNFTTFFDAINFLLQNICQGKVVQKIAGDALELYLSIIQQIPSLEAPQIAVNKLNEEIEKAIQSFITIDKNHKPKLQLAGGDTVARVIKTDLFEIPNKEYEDFTKSLAMAIGKNIEKDIIPKYGIQYTSGTQGKADVIYRIGNSEIGISAKNYNLSAPSRDKNIQDAFQKSAGISTVSGTPLYYVIQNEPKSFLAHWLNLNTYVRDEEGLVKSHENAFFNNNMESQTKINRSMDLSITAITLAGLVEGEKTNTHIFAVNDNSGKFGFRFFTMASIIDKLIEYYNKTELISSNVVQTGTIQNKIFKPEGEISERYKLMYSQTYAANKTGQIDYSNIKQRLLDISTQLHKKKVHAVLNSSILNEIKTVK